MTDGSRRQFLAMSSSGILGGLAGCSGLGTTDTGTATDVATEQTEPSTPATETQTDESERVTELEQKVAEKNQRIEKLQQRVQELETNAFEPALVDQAEKLGKRVRESVVVSIAEAERGTSTGTAWFIEEHRLITTGHGAGAVDSLTCWTVDGESFTADVVDSIHGDFQDYSHLDVSVLETEFSGTPLPTGTADSLAKDQPLLQVGHPNGIGNWVASLGRFVETDRFHGLRSTVPTIGGNSGSPTLTLEEKVVGLTTGTSPRESTRRSDGEAPTAAPTDVRTSYDDTMYASHTPVEAITAFADQA